ncbi:unnamed protein product [Orchesella dallaii]|uniref:Uncharacterized protein n=1 Tax=Orchesella dallaii TaxID=48710 RepID=A0ABP1RWS6_9HEXA
MDQAPKPTTTMTKEEARRKMFFVIRLDKNPKFLEIRKLVIFKKCSKFQIKNKESVPVNFNVFELNFETFFFYVVEQFDEVTALSATYISYKLILPLFLPALLRERLKHILLKFSEIAGMFYQWYKPLADAMDLAHHLKTEMGIWESYAVDRTLEMGIGKLVQLALADNRFGSLHYVLIFYSVIRYYLKTFSSNIFFFVLWCLDDSRFDSAAVDETCRRRGEKRGQTTAK